MSASERGALIVAHNNSYADQAAAAFGPIAVAILGPSPHLPPCCACQSRRRVVHNHEPLVRSSRFAPCALPPPLPGGRGVPDPASWARLPSAIHSEAPHRRTFAAQLARHDTARRTGALRTELERATGTPVARLHKTRSRSRESELSRQFLGRLSVAPDTGPAFDYRAYMLALSATPRRIALAGQPGLKQTRPRFADPRSLGRLRHGPRPLRHDSHRVTTTGRTTILRRAGLRKVIAFFWNPIGQSMLRSPATQRNASTGCPLGISGPVTY